MESWGPANELVKISGGRSVLMRRPGVLDVAEMLDALPDVSATSEPQSEVQKQKAVARNMREQATLICRCAVEPRFSLDTLPPDGHLSINVLTTRDVKILSDWLQSCLMDESKSLDPSGAPVP